MTNKLIILTCFENTFERDIKLPSYYKEYTFSDVFVVGRYANKITNIKNLNKNPDKHIILSDPTKLFDFNKKYDESLEEDYYRSPYRKTTETIDIDNDDTIFYYPEENSWYDSLFNYQLASIVKPNHFPFYVKNTKISSLSDFEMELFYEGIDLCKVYVISGFYKLQNNQNVPGWSVSPNTSWISLILSLYKIDPFISDLMPYQSMLSYARLRALVFYISTYELRKKFEDLFDEIEEQEIEEERERFFYDNLLDDNIKKDFLDNNESIYKMWTELDTYNTLREKI